MAKVETMKGLQIFIKKIRAANTPEDKDDVVAKEFAKIRNLFGGTSKISAYDKKKCIWKLLYAHMMGYDVDFGHKQAADLIPSTKYDEKQVGYQALTILLNENDEFMTLLVNNVLKDLESSIEPFQALALCFAGAVAGEEMSTAIAQIVIKILVNEKVTEVIRKKAALCLLRVYKKLPPDAGIITPEVWAPKLNHLLQTRSLGLKLSVMGLTTGILERSSLGYADLLQPRIVTILGDLIDNKTAARDYAYYGLPSPWLQVKCLRALSYFGPPADGAVLERLTHLLRVILDKYAMGKLANLNNAQNAVLFEAVTLVLHLDLHTLLARCVQKVASFTALRDPNSRYVALEAMSRLAAVPDMRDAILATLDRIYDCLRDPDVSVHKRAVDVLYCVCESDTAEAVVGAMLRHVAVADATIKEDLVLKVAILAERYAPSIAWYIETILSLMDSGAEEVNDDVWQRAIHLITNNGDMQAYSATNIVQRLQAGTHSVPLINTAGYVLAEYAPVLAASHPPLAVFELLMTRWSSTPPATRRLLLTAAIKLRINAYDDAPLQTAVEDLLRRCSSSQDVELQQRAVEYLVLSGMPREASGPVFATMPEWPERESSLLRRLRQSLPDDGGRQYYGTSEPSEVATGADEGTGTITPREAPSQTLTDAGPTASLPASPQQAPPGEAPPLPEATPLSPPRAEADLLGGDPDNLDDAFFGADAPLAAPRGVESNGPPTGAPPAPEAPRDELDDLMSLAPAHQHAPAPAYAPAAPYTGATAALPFPQDHQQQQEQQQQQQQQGQQSFAAPTTGGSVAPPAAGATARPVRVDNPTAAWPQLLLTGKGVLLEDTLLQVGWTSAVNGSQCMATLYLGNKGATPLTNLLLSILPSPALSNYFQGEIPTSLQPQQQVQVPILFLCHGASSAAPQLKVQYNVWPELLSYTCPLPITSGRFTSPDSAITPDRFFSFWNAPRAPPCKASRMLTTQTPLLPQALAQRMSSLAFSPGVVPVEPNPFNFAGSAFFVSTSPLGLQHQQVVTRVEVNPADLTTCLVTVISEQPELSEAVREWIAAGLQS